MTQCEYDHQYCSRIAYAIARHRPSENVTIKILNKLIDDGVDEFWNEQFRNTIVLIQGGGMACVYAYLMNMLVENGTCPVLVSISDILNDLDL
jgi:hypothetical protein